MTKKEILSKVKEYISQGLDEKGLGEIFSLIGAGNYSADYLKSIRLWGDFLPKGEEDPYTPEQRYLHILWETIDKVPMGIDIEFAIPFRRMIAKKLFKKCGKGFVANEGCRFNYGHLIEVGDYVVWNHCCYLDSKGGLSFGDYSMITEYTKIFTHGHSESDHEERSYSPVEIGEYAKVYTACTLLPGIKIGKGAICATGSIVTKSVDDFTMVAGIPAKPVRGRRTLGKKVEELNHYALANKAFQCDDEE